MSTESEKLRQALAWHHPRAIARSVIIRPRLYFAVAAGALAALLLPSSLPVPLRAAISWNLGALVYLSFAFWLMRSCDGDQVRARAARQDDSRIVILALILLAIASSFAAITGLINEAKAAKDWAKVAYIALACTTIVSSWTVTQVVFTLHYAHDYYRPAAHALDAKGGLDFPGETQPDYWDFLYFATSIGATSQTSDVSIRSKALRRLVTLHAVVAFFFNTTVLALTINIAASLI
jgi:uncharacterized membrane protein